MTERVNIIQNNKFEIEFKATDPHNPDSDELQSMIHINELTPYTMLLSSLGACTSIVLHTYAQNHELGLNEVELHLQYQRNFQKDQDEPSLKKSYEEKIEEKLILRGDLDQGDRQKLFRIAQQCSIHKMLEAGIEINSQLVN